MVTLATCQRQTFSSESHTHTHNPQTNTHTQILPFLSVSDSIYTLSGGVPFDYSKHVCYRIKTKLHT